MDDLTFGAALLRLSILTGEAENPGGQRFTFGPSAGRRCRSDSTATNTP